MATDTEILNWLETQYGLHRELEITYVVDGYEVEFTYDGNPTDGKQHHGETLRDALRKAMNAAPNAKLSGVAKDAATTTAVYSRPLE